MLYVNDYDIDIYIRRYMSHAVLHNATEFLAAFKEQVDSHSDGWAYWRPPVQAAAKLIKLIQSGEATMAQFRAAVIPIKAFYTRRGYAAGMQFPDHYGV